MIAICRKYKTVVIDPPWNLEKSLKRKLNYGLHSELPYNTLTDEEIQAWPINDYAAEDCALFMWVTHAKLPAGLDIVKNWGFKYHALLTWDKVTGLCLNGFHRRTEFVIYAYRGKFGVDVGEGNYIPTIFRQTATGHSKKPDLFYALLRDRTPEPRIDIFARKRHYGFDAFGDQVEKEMEIPLLGVCDL